MDDDPNEPTLPPLPPPPPQSRPRPTRPSLLTRKRTHSSYATDLDPLPPSAASSDPALFSGDEAAPGAENYEGANGKRKKKMYTGSWWSHRVKAGKADRKREFKRNVDSGVWMGSDESVGNHGSAEEGLSSDSLGSMEEAFLRDQGVQQQQQQPARMFRDGPEGKGEVREAQRRWMEEQKRHTLSSILRVAKSSTDAGSGTYANQAMTMGRATRMAAASLPEHEQVLALIRLHLERGSEDISFDGMHLSSLPPEILELATLAKEPTLVPGMLDTGRSFATRLKIVLSNNRFMRVPTPLLELGNLRVLSLRGNILTSVPAGIRRLTRLRELNVSNNQLMSLPFEVLELMQFHDLRVLWLDPNPWRVLPSTDEGSHRPPQLDPATLAVRICASCPMPAPSSRSSRGPSLSEVALRQLYRTCPSPRDDLRALMPEDDTPPSVLRALEEFSEAQHDGGRLCTMCHRLIVQAGSEWVEWWSVGASRLYVPFVRRICEEGCAGRENGWVEEDGRVMRKESMDAEASA